MFVVLLCSLPLALTALAPALSREDCLCFQGCCDNGWFQYRDACYKPFTNQVTWKDGEENCKKVGAHLASIHSEDENHFIYLLMGRLKDYTKHEAYWIGALSNDKNNNNPDKGSWTDGTQWDFDHFGPGQPDGLQDEYFIGSWKEEAAKMGIAVKGIYQEDNASGTEGHITWNDYKNSYQFQYICKKDIS